VNLIEEILTGQGLNELAKDSQFVRATVHAMAEAISMSIEDMERAALVLKTRTPDAICSPDAASPAQSSRVEEDTGTSDPGSVMWEDEETKLVNQQENDEKKTSPPASTIPHEEEERMCLVESLHT